jgi:hypothetical protein
MSGSTRVELEIDVSDAVPGDETLRTATTVVLPAEGALREAPVVFFAFPGGGYSRHYYDLQIDGFDGYSQAEHHAADGAIFVCCDHLAVGDSDVPNLPLDFEAVGRANAATAREILDRLERGELHDDLPPVRRAAAVALGQSFGGFVLTIGQANDPVFDGVAMLGWSGIETLPPWPADVDLADLLSGSAGDGMDHPMRAVFHSDAEPEELIRRDMTRGGAMGSPEAWGTANGPGGPAVRGTRGPLGPGVVAAEAAAIAQPVFVGCGVIDVVGDPWSEPTAYRGSRDVTVAVFEQMAHMHNFAPTRALLWNRLAAWAAGIVPSVG